MKYEMTHWKCFVLDLPSICDHIWYCVELFSETEHKMALLSILIAMDKRPQENLLIEFSPVISVNSANSGKPMNH